MVESKHEDQKWVTQFPVPMSLARRFAHSCIRLGLTRRAALKRMLERWVEDEEITSRKCKPPEIK